MVIFFDNVGNNVRKVLMAEHNVMIPTIPSNIDFNGKVAYYSEKDLRFIAIINELGGEIFNYDVVLDSENNFLCLQPINK